MDLTDHFFWLASDSWGAKSTPVENQEWAAEGAVTILPQRTVLKGGATSSAQQSCGDGSRGRSKGDDL